MTFVTYNGVLTWRRLLTAARSEWWNEATGFAVPGSVFDPLPASAFDKPWNATRMPCESYRRRLRSLLLYLCYVSRALINSLVCWFSRENLCLAWSKVMTSCSEFDVMLNVSDKECLKREEGEKSPSVYYSIFPLIRLSSLAEVRATIFIEFKGNSTRWQQFFVALSIPAL